MVKILGLDRCYQRFFIALVLMAMTVAVFGQVGGYDFNNYDDELYITKNSQVQGGLTRDGVVWAFTTFHASNWHPLTWLSHMLDSELYGLNPTGHHLTNVLLHLVNVLLLFGVLFRMSGGLWPSAFVAALFAVHPLHVESVAWVAERKDVLSTLVWLWTMWAYLRYTERPSYQRYLLVVLALALGLMAKPMLVTLPFVLLLLDYWPLGRLRLEHWRVPAERRTAWKLVREKLPLVALSVASCVVTYIAQGRAINAFEAVPLSVRIENALVAYVSYIGKLLWPHNLAVFYPHPGQNLPMWQVMGAAVLLVGVTVLVLLVVKRRPYLAVGWFWYLGTLVPVIGLVQLGNQAMADRYTYVPLIGLFIMIAWGVSDLTAGWRYQRAMLILSAGIVLSALMGAAWSQVHYWRNSITLFGHALNVTVGNYVAHNNLGIALAQQGKLKEAIGHYVEVLRIKPNYVTYINLGEALTQQGRFEEAGTQYAAALRINPNDARAHNALGLALAQQGRLEEAISHFSQALRIRPDYEEARNNLNAALLQQGR